MDYKYIEQLLERYWRCETSLEEERILRIFFCQKEIPLHLRPYRSLFVYQVRVGEMKPDESLGDQVLEEIERPVVKARHISLYTRFMPLFKAVAVLALLLVLGGLMKYAAYDEPNGIVYVYDQFDNHVSKPQVAYEGDSVNTIIHDKSPNPKREADHKQ